MIRWTGRKLREARIARACPEIRWLIIGNWGLGLGWLALLVVFSPIWIAMLIIAGIAALCEWIAALTGAPVQWLMAPVHAVDAARKKQIEIAHQRMSVGEIKERLGEPVPKIIRWADEAEVS